MTKNRKFIIKTADVGDAIQIDSMIKELDLYEKNLLEEDDLPSFSQPTALEGLNESNKSWHTIVVKDTAKEKLIGFCRGTIGKDDPDGYGYLRQIFVKDGYRNQHIGKHLILSFSNICKEYNVHTIVIPTIIQNVRARNFYKSILARETVIELEGTPSKIIEGCKNHI